MNAFVWTATFLTSTVEFVEAYTIILAVGLTKGLRTAGSGTMAALAVLVLAILLLGKGFLLLPLSLFQAVFGTLLLLFGVRWLATAILRAAGRKSQRDEGAVFAKALDEQKHHRAPGFLGIDLPGFMTSFSGVMVEGLEVVFAVVTFGAATASFPSAVAGAASGLALVVLLALLFHRPLTRVPENGIKYTVGILLVTFGTLFTGEGIGVPWWGGTFSALPLLGFYLVLALTTTLLLRPRRQAVPTAERSQP